MLTQSVLLLEVFDDTLIWSFVEPQMSIIAACLPTLGSLVRGVQSPTSILQWARSTLSLRRIFSRGATDDAQTSGTVYIENIENVEKTSHDCELYTSHSDMIYDNNRSNCGRQQPVQLLLCAKGQRASDAGSFTPRPQHVVLLADKIV